MKVPNFGANLSGAAKAIRAQNELASRAFKDIELANKGAVIMTGTLGKDAASSNFKAIHNVVSELGRLIP